MTSLPRRLAFSMLLSLFLVFQIWRLKAPVTNNLQNSIALISATLQTTAEGLLVADESLEASQESITTLESTIETLAKTIEDTSPLLSSLETMLGDDLPNTISSTQTSLTTAQESARIIESVLSAITSVPLLFQESYNPEVPLHVALGEAAESLEDLPESFETMETSLQTAQGNLRVIKVEMRLIAQDIGEINTNLEDAKTVVEKYQGVVAEMQTGVAGVAHNLPRWINIAVWVLTFMILWSGAAQWSLFIQGWSLLSQNKKD